MKNKFYVSFPISNQITKFIKIYLHTSDEEGEEVLEALDEDEEEDDDEGSSPDIRKFIMFIKFNKLKLKKKVEEAKCDRFFKNPPGNGFFSEEI